MKFCLSLIIWFLSVAACYAQSYKIEVQIEGLADSSVILGAYGGSNKFAIDTAVFDANNLAIFSKPNKLNGGMYFLILNKFPIIDFLISDGDEHFKIVIDRDNYSNVRFENSLENSAMLDYLSYRIQHQQSHANLLEQIERNENNGAVLDSLRHLLFNFNKPLLAYSQQLASEYKGKFLASIVMALCPIEDPDFGLINSITDNDTTRALAYYKFNKDHFFDNVDFSDDRLLRTPFFRSNVLDYYFQKVLVFKNSDSIIPCVDAVLERSKANKLMFRYTLSHLFHFYHRSKLMGHEEIVIHLAENYYLTDKVDWENDTFKDELRTFIQNNKASLIGKISPDLILPANLGTHQSIHGLDADYIVLYFYSPDCDVCNRETNKLKEIYNKYKDQYKLEVFAVNTKTDENEWHKYINDNNLTWINVWDEHNTAHLQTLFDTKITPKIYLLDKDKKIIGRRLDPKTLEALLKFSIENSRNINIDH